MSELKNLPTWDLTDLYQSIDDPKIKQDLDHSKGLIQQIVENCEGKMATMSGDELAKAIQTNETLDQTFGRIMSFAGLMYQADTSDLSVAKFMGDLSNTITDMSAPLVFFTLELNKIDDDTLAKMYAQSEALTRYKPWISRISAIKDYQLSHELDSFLHDNSVVGATAWNRLFDETLAGLKFDVDGEEKSLEATLSMMSDTNADKRKTAAKALEAVFEKNARLFTLVMNTLIKEKEIEDRWRKYPAPQTGRHLANQIEPEVVQALQDAVTANFERTSHRYYKYKAKQLGMEKMNYWDRNAPLFQKEDRKISWEEAKETVLTAYNGFSPKMTELAEPFFSKNWIDAAERPGKTSGAFAHPTTTDVHPYILINYLGKQRDVMTLAHELGHGVHQRLAAQQGEYLSRTPLTLAETASVFGEMLTFQKLLREETDPTRKKALLSGKIEDMINTVVRQIAFYTFECRLHEERRSGELTSDKIGQIWMEVQQESLGSAFEFDEGYQYFWMYVSHFVHVPFYVYAYAFGDGLVNALYAVYEQGHEGFQQRYFDLLSAGGTKHHKELLAPFGLDASDPAFWNQGLNLISSMIDQLESME
jgi:oligoendopeptidase F